VTTNTAVTALVWLALVAHLMVAGIVLQQRGPVSLIPIVNLLVAGSVLVYWGQRWFGYLFRGITWYATDQLIPLYAVAVAVAALLTLSGRYSGTMVHWLAFGVNTIVLVGAALFVSFFRLTRLI